MSIEERNRIAALEQRVSELERKIAEILATQAQQAALTQRQGPRRG